MLAKLSGVGKRLKDVDLDDRRVDGLEAIILSMTEEERRKPAIINPSRKRRIAAGSGMKVEGCWNRLLRQFEQTQKMMRSIRNKKGKRHIEYYGMPGMRGRM